ncbi:hypothetical protein C8R44DRAFT_895956 [Mycena epipterygia]|nr:hypothetical protein C8R44DRAFT_895956 [Mycena epipterygia]
MSISQGWQLHQIPLVPRPRVLRSPPSRVTQRRHYPQCSNLTARPSVRATTPTARTNRGSEACVASSFRFDYDTPAPRVNCDTYACPRQLGRVMRRHIPSLYANNWEHAAARWLSIAPRSGLYDSQRVVPTSRLSQPSARTHRRAQDSAGAFLTRTQQAGVTTTSPARACTLSLRECTPNRCTPPCASARCVPSVGIVPPHAADLHAHRTAAAGVMSHLPTLHTIPPPQPAHESGCIVRAGRALLHRNLYTQFAARELGTQLAARESDIPTSRGGARPYISAHVRYADRAQPRISAGVRRDSVFLRGQNEIK